MKCIEQIRIRILCTTNSLTVRKFSAITEDLTSSVFLAREMSRASCRGNSYWVWHTVRPYMEQRWVLDSTLYGSEKYSSIVETHGSKHWNFLCCVLATMSTIASTDPTGSAVPAWTRHSTALWQWGVAWPRCHQPAVDRRRHGLCCLCTQQSGQGMLCHYIGAILCLSKGIQK